MAKVIELLEQVAEQMRRAVELVDVDKISVQASQAGLKCITKVPRSEVLRCVKLACVCRNRSHGPVRPATGFRELTDTPTRQLLAACPWTKVVTTLCRDCDFRPPTSECTSEDSFTGAGAVHVGRVEHSDAGIHGCADETNLVGPGAAG